MMQPASAPSTAPHPPPAPTCSARLAASRSDLIAAHALRLEVFNPELDQGWVHSCDTGLAVDPFDEVCDQLIVEDTNHRPEPAP